MKKLVGVLVTLLLMAVPVFAAEYEASDEDITDDAYWEGYDDGYNDAYNSGYSNGYSDGYYDGLNGNEYYDYTDDYDDYEEHEMCWVKLNGDYVWFDAQDSVLIDGSAFVPMRGMCEMLGADVVWDGETRTATCLIDDKIVTFTIDSADYTINGEHFTLPVKVQLVNGCTMLPVRAFCEAFGATVEWDDVEKDVIISYLRKLNDDEQLLYNAITKDTGDSLKIDADLDILNDELGNIKISGSIYADGKDVFYGNFKTEASVLYDILSINADVNVWIFNDEDESEYYITVNGHEISDDEAEFLPFYEIADLYNEYASVTSDSINKLFFECKSEVLPSSDGCKIIKLYHEDEYLYDDWDSGEPVYGNGYDITFYISNKTGNIEKIITYYKDEIYMEITLEYDKVEVPALPLSAKKSLKEITQGFRI